MSAGEATPLAGKTGQGRGLENAPFETGEYNFIHRLSCLVLSVTNEGSFDILKFSTIASRRGHKHVYSFSLFVSSKTRHHAELFWNFPLNTVTALKQ